MECWICGQNGTTKEHLLKASDLKSEFGSVSQKSPLFYYAEGQNSQKINSIKKSSLVKSKALICSHCNNARTAPYDKAWEKLSTYIRNIKDLRAGKILKLNKIFPGNASIQMLNIHLYFVKLFGCVIKEHNIPISLTQFSSSLINNVAHPNVFISFGPSGGMGTGNTEVGAESVDGSVTFATWFYVVGSTAVNIMYALPTEKRQGLIKAWHPKSVNKKIKLANYKT
jgi:hypothetical protein